MPHQVRPEENIHSAGGAPVPAGGARPRTYDDWPTVPSGVPVCPGDRPAPAQPTASGAAGVERLRAFVDAVLGMHRVLADRFIPMCSCGSPARHCPIVRAEHEVLGVAMPFTFDPVRPPHHQVRA